MSRSPILRHSHWDDATDLGATSPRHDSTADNPRGSPSPPPPYTPSRCYSSSSYSYSYHSPYSTDDNKPSRPGRSTSRSKQVQASHQQDGFVKAELFPLPPTHADTHFSPDPAPTAFRYHTFPPIDVKLNELIRPRPGVLPGPLSQTASVNNADASNSNNNNKSRDPGPDIDTEACYFETLDFSDCLHPTGKNWNPHHRHPNSSSPRIKQGRRHRLQRLPAARRQQREPHPVRVLLALVLLIGMLAAAGWFATGRSGLLIAAAAG